MLVGYGSAALELSRPYVLGIALLGGLAISAGVTLGGALSDRIGRRWVIARVACDLTCQ
jgi:predicted MFS family arabinose efflux permease